MGLVVGQITGVLFLSTPVIVVIGVGMLMLNLALLLLLRRFVDRAGLFESQVR